MVSLNSYEFLDDELTHENCISIPVMGGGYGWQRVFFDPQEKRFICDYYSTGVIDDGEIRYHGSEYISIEEVKKLVSLKGPLRKRGVSILNSILTDSFPGVPLIEMEDNDKGEESSLGEKNR